MAIRDGGNEGLHQGRGGYARAHAMVKATHGRNCTFLIKVRTTGVDADAVLGQFEHMVVLVDFNVCSRLGQRALKRDARSSCV